MARNVKKEQQVAFEALVRQGFADAVSTTQGRAMLWSLLDMTGLYSASFHPGSARWTDYSEGKRANGRAILARILAADRGAYIRMQQENLERMTDAVTAPTNVPGEAVGDGDDETP